MDPFMIGFGLFALIAAYIMLREIHASNKSLETKARRNEAQDEGAAAVGLHGGGSDSDAGDGGGD